MAIIILCAVVCPLIGYIAYDKFIVKEDTKNEEAKKEEETQERKEGSNREAPLFRLCAY